MDGFPTEAREYARDLDLPPKNAKGWVHEVEVPMRKGEALAYTTEHAEPGGRVEFNVHSHEGREVTYHVKGTDARIAGTFRAPWDGKFYLMWENLGGNPIRVIVRARRS